MIQLRPATAADAATIAAQRSAMFRENRRDAAAVAATEPVFRAWVAGRLADGRYAGLLAEAAGAVVGGVGMMVIDWPPHPFHPDRGCRGYILNVWVDPAQRGRGLAKRMMLAAEEKLRAMGASYVILHATAAGRPLYEGLGYRAGTEVGKAL